MAAASSGNQPAPANGLTTLPVVTVKATPVEIVEKLDAAARRGRLAGFERGDNGVLFYASAFGSPFEGDLQARADAGSGRTSLHFTTRMRRKVLWIFVAAMAVSIWPGTPITKSLLASLLPSWHWLWETTWYWYFPLAVIGAPWAIWSAVKRSRKEIAVSAVEMVGKIEKELGAKGTAGPEAGSPG